MERGDLIFINLHGREVLFCVVGLYKDRNDGEDIVVMALIDPQQIVHVKSELLGIREVESNLIH